MSGGVGAGAAIQAIPHHLVHTDPDQGVHHHVPGTGSTTYVVVLYATCDHIHWVDFSELTRHVRTTCARSTKINNIIYIKSYNVCM